MSVTAKLSARELRQRLRESEQTLDAIRRGHVDSILVDGPRGTQLFTLDSPDQPYRLFVEHMNEGAATLSRDGTILYCNTRMAEMVGSSQAKLLGQPVDTFFDLPKYKDFAFLSQQAFLYKIRARGHLRGPNAHLVPVLVSLNEVPLDKGRSGLCLVATDLTEQVQTEEELKRSNEDLQQFAYVASHDLQEPLRMVASFTQLLQQRYAEKLDATANEYIHFAVDGARRMQGLIEDLLDFSRVTTRRRPTQPCPATRIVENALRNLFASIQESGASIHVGDLPEILADELQLQSVFQNLIANAIKFRSPDRPCTIHVEAHDQGKMWVFSVADNGISIEPRHFDRIFQVFQRLHRREDYPGNGIGLAICKKIIERHRGKIWLESLPGQGTTFFFSIPNTRSGIQDEVPCASAAH